MKIRSIHFHQVGPLGRTGLAEYSFADSWKGGLHENILLSGVNGSGKSTVLRAVANLWAFAGSFLSSPLIRTATRHDSHRWLARWGGVAVIFEAAPIAGRMGIAFGEREFFGDLFDRLPDVHWLGGPWPPAPRKEPWMDEFADLFRELILKNARAMPNLVYLDGEERRWVSPKKGRGDVVPDDPQMRWLATYQATGAWRGQLEASLITLKTLDESHYMHVLSDLNKFLRPKAIDPQPDEASLRLHVGLPGDRPENSFLLDDLSAGEHQVLIQLYLVSRWLNPGGIVMIDEPDLHLHPSLLNGFLSRLETLVAERQGQLLLTSHNPDLWQRYENKGLRIQLGGGQ